MPKPTKRHTAELTALLTDLRRQLRSRSKNSPPLYVVEIKTHFSRHPDFLQILMRGIAGPSQSYIHLGAGPEIGDIIAFAPTPEDLSKTLITLREITPTVFSLIEKLRTPAKKNPQRRRADPVSPQPTVDHQLAMVAPLICTLAEIAKSNYPRARSLPKIVAGPIIYHREGHLQFPTGEKIYSDAINPDLWQQIQTDLNQNQPTMRMLEAPVLQAAAGIIRQMLLALKPAPKPKRKKLPRSQKV
jgi:hypothetical protein